MLAVIATAGSVTKLSMGLAAELEPPLRLLLVGGEMGPAAPAAAPAPRAAVQGLTTDTCVFNAGLYAVTDGLPEFITV